MIKYSLFIFIFHTCAEFQKEEEGFIMTCVFECFQSHCHILKELHEFLCMMDVITSFGESFVGYGLVSKSVGLGPHRRRW
jgi:hypothetical protein